MNLMGTEFKYHFITVYDDHKSVSHCKNKKIEVSSIALFIFG